MGTFLYGDSSESRLEINYLAFVREVMDCAVALVEHEGYLATAVERRRTRTAEAAAVSDQLEELGRKTMALYAPLFKEHGDSPVGRSAKQIASAARDVITAEVEALNKMLATDLENADQDDQKRWRKSFGALEKLLKTHDLPEAMKSFEVTLDEGRLRGGEGEGVGPAKSGGRDNVIGKPKAVVVQRTSFGVEATLGLDVPGNSILKDGLLVEKLVDNAEVSSLAAGGWIKKSDKLVPYKIGKYAITKVLLSSIGIQVRLRDASGSGFDLTTRDSDVLLERINERDGRSFALDDRNKAGLKQLCDKLEAAVRSLGDSRALATIAIDGKPLADCAHPQVFAERLILAIAPTVAEISRHSQSADELVLRRQLADDRREEIFVKKSDLLKKLDGLAEAGRQIFAPLDLEKRPAPAPRRTMTAAPPLTPPSPSLSSRQAHNTIDLEDVEPIEEHMVEDDVPSDVVRINDRTMPVAAIAKKAVAVIVESDEADEGDDAKAGDDEADEIAMPRVSTKDVVSEDNDDEAAKVAAIDAALDKLTDPQAAAAATDAPAPKPD